MTLPPEGSSTSTREATTCVVGDESAEEQLARGLARELRHQWRKGNREPAERYLARHPELWERPEAAVDVIYEEYCLREQGGEEGVEEDLLRRFPAWAGPLRLMLDCHRRLIDSDRRSPRYPMPGDRLGDFELIEEIARGSRGRVFLARQTTLAERVVVLKVTPLDGAEHFSLARLQHTNIVPLYSAADDEERNLRVLCMPHFGRATLASVQQALRDVPMHIRTGRHLVEAVDAIQGASGSPASSPHAAGAARQMLLHASYVQAVCWIGACLADALQFAHERSLVHLDLKPSNVLLTTDGQPMLLDFHLARMAIEAGTVSPGRVGGTPQYMPPEQRAAMQSLHEGRRVEEAVDGLADVYGLGAMMYELLGGTAPIGEDSPALRRMNDRVSAGLSDVIAKCVAARPGDRYGDARGVAEDLRRHLTDQPLLGVANRSVRERWHKWRRRRPAALRMAALILLVMAAASALVGKAWSDRRDRTVRAEVALLDGGRLLDARQFAEAVQSFERGLVLTRDFGQDPTRGQRLRDRLAEARRLQLADQLHRLVEEIRPLYGAALSPERTAVLWGNCTQLWERRASLIDAAGRSRDPRFNEDLLDLAIIAAHLRSALPGSSVARTEALKLLDEAEAQFGPHVVIDQERDLHLRAQRLPALPARDGVRQARSAWEHAALGRALLASGDAAGAAAELASAVRLDPGGLWPNFYHGVCLHRTGRHEEAVAAFSTCIGATPRVAALYHNRALALVALGRLDRAAEDRDRALSLDRDDRLVPAAVAP